MVVHYLFITPLEFILSAVPVAILFIVVLVYVISAYWREDARGRVKEFSSTLREIQHRFKLAEQRMRCFAQVRSEVPFIDVYERTNAALILCKTTLKEQYQRYSALQQEIADQMVNHPRNMIMAPYLWFETRRKQQRFDRDLNLMGHMGQELEKVLQELEHVGQATAAAAQSAWQQLQTLGNTLQTLSQRQIHGEKFSAVRQRYNFIHAQLSQLPAHFINFSAQNNSQFDNHAEIIKVSAVLDQHTAELSALYHNCQNWEAQHNLVHEQLHQLTEHQQEIAERLGQLSIGIDSTPLLQTLNECRIQIRNIRERARRTEADDLRYLLRETRQTARILETLQEEIKQLNHLFDGYQQTRSQLDSEWAQLKNLAYRLSQSPFLPIQLDQTAPSLNTLHKEISALPLLNVPMTPDTLRSAYTHIQKLLKTCQKYTPEIEVLQNNHAELLILLKRLKTDEINHWVDEIRSIHQMTNVYHSDNYYHSPALVNLDVIQEITQIQQQTVSLPQIDANVKESMVLEMLGQAREMENRRKVLDEAYHDRRQQFVNLQVQQQTLKEKLDALSEAIEEMDTIMLVDSYLHQKAARSIRLYDKKRESLLRLLEHPQEGMLQNKVREYETLDEQMQKDLRVWQEDLYRREHEDRDRLAATMKSIHQVAVLQEDLLEEAGLILQQQSQLEAVTNREENTVLERVQQLKASQGQQSTSQELLADLQQIQTDLKQISDALDTALFRCNEKITSAERWIDPSGWNQRALSFDRLRKEVEAVQTAVNRLRQTGTDLKSFSSQANTFIKRLSETEKRIDQIIMEGEQERKTLQEAETAIETTLTLWRKLADERLNDREVRFGVQDMLQQYQQQLSQERKKFERGNLPLENYLRSLKQIDRRLNAESVPSEEGKRVDITGRTFR